MPLAPSRLPPGEVHVSCFDAEAGGLDAPTWSRLLGWLQPDERARFDRYRDLEARASFLIGRGIARRVLADATGVPPAEWRFVEGARGRPEIAVPETDLRFNLAHSGGLVACVIGVRRDVGVDVEHLDRPALSHDVAARSCAPDELADINSEPEHARQRRFLAYWTLKEAYLKARGLGISVPMAEVAFSLDAAEPRLDLRGSMADAGARWIFRMAQPTSRHLVAVAADCRDSTTPVVTFQRIRTEHLVDG